MIDYELRGDVARVTLDRPAKKNALTLDGLRDLAAAFDRADDEARAVVLRGAGDAFCAGDDIASIAGLETPGDVAALSDALHGALFGAERLGIPVVAAVDGLAYGGGFELVGAADLAVATPGAAFALPETTIGAYPPYAVARIAALCGKKRLLELALTGEAVDAETAAEWGLVNRVVPAGDLDGAVAAYVDAVRAVPPEAVKLVKRYARAGLADADERDRVAAGFARVAADEACREAAREFLEG